MNVNGPVADRGGNRKKNVIVRVLTKAKEFLSRLLYIISLVWQTSPLILISMCALCLLDGVLPVIGAYITKYLMNGIAELIAASPELSESVFEDLFVTLRVVVFLFVLEMIYLFLRRILEKYILNLFHYRN